MGLLSRIASAAEPPPPAEITVVGNEREEREELGSTHVPREETRFIPGAFGDPFRVVETLPGVSPIVSGIPYFFVRGAPPGDVGYSIDGVRVPLLFHVGAGPSVLPPLLVSRVDLYPSAYPASFGRYVGGVIAGETTTPSAKGRAEVQARIFDAGGAVEQPFADGKGSVLVGGRYGYTGALLSLVAPDYGLGYWDYQARIAYSLTPHDRLSLFSFGGYDHLENKALGRTLFDVQFHRVDLRWDHREEGRSMRVGVTFADDRVLSAPEDLPISTATKSRGWRWRMEGDERVSSRLRVRYGADLGFDRYEAEHAFPSERPARTDLYSGAWMDLVGRLGHGVQVVPGLRFDAMRVRGEEFLGLDPRFATRARLSDGVAWISAFGIAHQAPTAEIAVPGQVSGGPLALPQTAYQASETLELTLPSHMLLKATAFASIMRGEYAYYIAGGPIALERRHRFDGRNYGLEVFLRRDFTERLGGLVSYTLSRAERTTDGPKFLSNYDRTHVLSAAAGYDLGDGFRIGARFFFETGRMDWVRCLPGDCRPTGVEFVRLPSFARLDVRFEKRWTYASGGYLALTAEWFNATLSREAASAVQTTQGIVTTWNPVLTLPSVGVEAGY